MHEYLVFRNRKCIGSVFANTIVEALDAARSKYCVASAETLTVFLCQS